MLASRISRAVKALVSAATLLSAFSPAQAGQVELVSRRDPGFVAPELIGDAGGAALSADGRWAAFTSTAPNLVSGQSDANSGADVFLLDRLSGTVTLVSHSVLSPATTGTGTSDSPSISADGRYVVFQSGAVNLISGQTETAVNRGVFLYDRDTGSITVVSHKAGSATATTSGYAQEASISKDGGSVVFVSNGTDLISGLADANGFGDVFVYDRLSGAVALVSHTAASTINTGNGTSFTPRTSADGRYVLFASSSTDLVSGQVDATPSNDLFLHDRMTGMTVLVSRAAGTSATAANDYSTAGGLSDDGAYAVFASYATDLVAGQTDMASSLDVFLFERATGTVTLLSHADGAAATAAGASSPTISGDGGWAAFESGAVNLVPGQTDTNGARDVFLWQRATGATTLASHASSAATTGGNAGTSGQYLPLSLSGDGRYLLFLSPAMDLVTGQSDTNGALDAFLYDRVAGTATLVSHVHGSPTAASTAGAVALEAPTLSLDGTWASFTSTASDLTSDVDPGGRDLFLYERASGANLSFTYGETVTRLTPDGSSSFGVGGASRDGRYIALFSQATDLVPGQVDGAATTDVFLVDRLAGTTTLVSHAAGAPATAADHSSGIPALSDDGAWLVFESNATNLIPDIAAALTGYNVFLYGRGSGALTLVSRRASDPTKAGNGFSFRPAVSGDGRYVTFFSGSSNLVTGQVDTVSNSGDVFLYDRVTGGMSLVSHTAGNPLQAANDDSAVNQNIGISRDGRWVFFSSEATDLVAGQTDGNAGSDLFLYDRVTGSVTLVTRSASSPATTANTPTLLLSIPAISPDGRYVAFLSAATNLVSGQVDLNGEDDLFLFDRLSGAVTLISRQSGTLAAAANGRTLTPWFSEDGLFLVFSSLATNLVPGQVEMNQSSDPFLYDLSTGILSLLSPDGISTHPSASTTPLAAGPGARTVLLSSSAMDLVPGQVDVNGAGSDLFLLDRLTGARTLVSRSPASRRTTGNNSSNFSLLRSGGSLAVFASGASDLAAGDFNADADVFVYSAGSTAASDLYTVTPCRALDTRSGSPLSSGTAELATLHGVCGVPATAVAVAVNVTAVGATGSGNLRVYPGDVEPPTASSVNFQTGVTRANNAVLPLAYDGTGTLGLLATVAGGGTVHVIVDVVGYFR